MFMIGSMVQSHDMKHTHNVTEKKVQENKFWAVLMDILMSGKF